MSNKDPFEINTAARKYWKYTEDEVMRGTVVELSLIPDTDFNTKQPKYFKDGNPIMKYLLALKQEDGSEILWPVKMRGTAIDAIKKALDPQGTRNSINLRETLGLVLKVSTRKGVYNNNNPRPYWVEILGKDTVTPIRGAKEAPAKPEPAPAPQNMQPYQPYQQPVPQDAYDEQMPWE